MLSQTRRRDSLRKENEGGFDFDSPSHPNRLAQRGFMPLNFSPHPKLVPDLCPEPFAFQRSICRLQIPGLAPGTSRFNGPSIPATNLVTFSKYSENSCESPSIHLFPLAAVFPDRLFAYSVSSLHRGEVRHNLVLTWNRQSQVCKLPDCKQRGQVMTFR